MADGWSHALSRRARNRGGDELATILAGSPPGVLSMTGGFPNPATFPGEALDEIAARLLRDDAAVALQYAPTEGLPSVRDYLGDRQEQLHGRRPGPGELIVTSGGMECIQLLCQALVDPGDAVAVEAPTYLGALMAFAGAQAGVHAVPTDEDGLSVDALEERLAAGLRPKFLYVIPEFQNPTGRTLPLARREALVELCRRHRVLVVEDVAYRELAFDGGALPSLWSLAPDVVLQAGTFSKIFFPGVRLGWAAGPREVVEQLAAAKQTTDQCAAALGQRLVEEYGRAGHFERALPRARALYASHWEALARALERDMPPGCAWTRPRGGFLTWMTLPEHVDTVALREAALRAGVAYVPGSPFHVGGEGRNELRLSFSHLTESELDLAAQRLAAVVRAAVGPGTPAAR
jgi:2-aminoadipate transaminase